MLSILSPVQANETAVKKSFEAFMATSTGEVYSRNLEYIVNTRYKTYMQNLQYMLILDPIFTNKLNLNFKTSIGIFDIIPELRYNFSEPEFTGVVKLQGSF